MSDSSGLSQPHNSIKQRFTLNGKRVLFVGVGGQIGRATVQSLRELGAEIVAISRRKESLDLVMSNQDLTLGNIIGGFTCDITIPAEITRTVDQVRELLNGKPISHIVINSGGVVKGIGPSEYFEDFSPNDLEAAYRLNYFGPVEFARQAIKLADGAENPFLGAVCSMSYSGKLSRVFAYRGAKAALHDWLSFMTQELMKKSKTWTVIGWAPGFVLAEQNAAVLDSVRKAAILDHMPRGEWQTAQEIADVIASSCTDIFRPCHGEVLNIAAGFSHAGLGMKAL